MIKTGSFLLLIIILLFAGCRSARHYRYDIPLYVYEVSAKGGGNWGGFIENTDVDAITGATEIGINAGIRGIYNFGKHGIETGIDYITFEQKVDFNDRPNNVFGSITTQYQLLNIPLMMNFNILRSRNLQPFLTLKAGIMAGILFHDSTTQVGAIPPYELKKFNIGPAVGLQITPLQYKQLSAGVFLDAYRGTRVFKEELYHSDTKFGNMSHLQFGIMIKYGIY